MKFILDRVIDTASDRKSRNPWTKNGAEVLGVVSFVVRSSRITVDMLLSLRAHIPNSSLLARRGLFGQPLKPCSPNCFIPDTECMTWKRPSAFTAMC
jgi:hypothetical protein